MTASSSTVLVPREADAGLSGEPGLLRCQQVFDRALARAGGRSWWSVVLGRVRAQRLWKLHRDGERSVSRPSSPCRHCSVTWLRSGGMAGGARAVSWLLHVAATGETATVIAVPAGGRFEARGQLRAGVLHQSRFWKVAPHHAPSPINCLRNLVRAEHML